MLSITLDTKSEKEFVSGITGYVKAKTDKASKESFRAVLGKKSGLEDVLSSAIKRRLGVRDGKYFRGYATGKLKGTSEYEEQSNKVVKTEDGFDARVTYKLVMPQEYGYAIGAARFTMGASMGALAEWIMAKKKQGIKFYVQEWIRGNGKKTLHAGNRPMTDSLSDIKKVATAIYKGRADDGKTTSIPDWYKIQKKDDKAIKARINFIASGYASRMKKNINNK